MSDVPNTVVASPPVLLRQAREEAGLHIAALAAFLKVPVKKLEALEAGRYDELPDMTFARALASSACRHLKIDPAPVLDQIPTASNPSLGERSPAINTPFKGAAGVPTFNPAGWLSRPAVLIAVVLLLGALVLWFFPLAPGGPSSDALLPPATSQTEESRSATPADTVEPARDVSALPAPSASAPPAPAEPPTVAAQAGADTPQPTALVPTAVSAPPAAAVPGSLLSIVATGDTWVEVVNGNRSQVVQRMLKAGDVLSFSSAPPYSVVIGRSDAAQVAVRGRPFDIAPFARNSVARFEVK